MTANVNVGLAMPWMKTLAMIGLAVAIVTQPAAANPAQCTVVVTATGRAGNPQNYEPPRHYDAEKLASARAIQAWQAKAAHQCPHYSNLWTRARNRKLDCEGHAGGISCQASATPAR